MTHSKASSPGNCAAELKNYDSKVRARHRNDPNDTSESLNCKIDVITLSNNQSILRSNLLRSPSIESRAVSLHVVNNARSAALGYNQALKLTHAPIAVLAHQDVYLPPGWDTLLRKRISKVSSIDQNWAVIAPFGVGKDATAYGPVWSTSLGQIVGRVSPTAVPIMSADELLLIVRRDADLEFDELLTGFHLYGTDIIQIARARGLASYSTPLPLIHNDVFKSAIDESFGIAYHYLRKKWRFQLPIYAPAIKITWHGLDLKRQSRHYRSSIKHRRSLALPSDEDPRYYASLCGWSNLHCV